MKYLDYKIEVLNYVIPYFRGNTDVKNILLAIGEKFNEFQDVIVYLLNTLTIKNAQGIWLDDIGKEVGTTRDEVDFGNYFCVNMPHVNVEKIFSPMYSERCISLGSHTENYVNFCCSCQNFYNLNFCGKFLTFKKLRPVTFA